MREDLLHYIWKYRKLQVSNVYTSTNEPIRIMEVGAHNLLAGPDFFNAKIVIGEQLWAGTVEIHVKSSDWYAHHHEQDPNYNNVILHVVWEDDVNVYRKDNTIIPTLVLKNYISQEVLDTYLELFQQNGGKFINCGHAIENVSQLIWRNWLERLYFERLENKWLLVSHLLLESKNDWEKVFFIMLAKGFGLKINGDAFYEIAKQCDFSMIRKIQNDTLRLESAFFGLAGFLSQDIQGDDYYNSLKKEFEFLSTKFLISESQVQKPQFFRLRPSNFPTIRLSQLANLYFVQRNIFSKILAAKSIEELYRLFAVSASPYWDRHYTFGKESGSSPKKLSKKFMDLLIINTVLPIKIGYSKHFGEDIGEEIIQIMSGVKAENNSVISNFKSLKVSFPSALESQAVLQLYNDYCVKNKCLQCVVGHGLLNGKA
ncbi:hypothetical protein KCTC52924_02294 [Arenibacter antarcticus]|uniref:DUF2851 family protein n=1 Tax=Arenibacter antarcticus TaxID=2040469 RepID=A0ABW5VKR2_9FLAO|nr:DUF2851 family protein [Arenibacter sp. H213]MCM4169696.1 DUF2851 domain-containing protein [Arenibacter sp. H213]